MKWFILMSVLPVIAIAEPLNELNEALSIYGAVAEVDESEGAIRLKLQRRISFDHDSREPKRESSASISALSVFSDFFDGQVLFNLQGHTDRSGSTEYNLILGMDRAKRIGGLLRHSESIPTSEGEDYPRSNVPAENRRVEVSANFIKGDDNQ